MTERLDASITKVQDFVLDRLGGVLTELEIADLTKRILTLVHDARFPFEMKVVDMSHGLVVTVPDSLTPSDVKSVKLGLTEKLGPDIPFFICLGDIKIHEFHAALVIAARRFVDHCYACRGMGVSVVEVEKEVKEGEWEKTGEKRQMNCGVCCDLRAALGVFDKHNIPQSRDKPIIPPSGSVQGVFKEGDPVLYKDQPATFENYIAEDAVSGTPEPQPNSLIRARIAGQKIDGYQILEVPTEHLRFDTPEA